MTETNQCSYQIMDYIFDHHQIRFSISGLNKWRHRQSFSYKKPKGVPQKFNPVKQTEFIDKYEALKAQVTDEPILFIDAMHPTQATKVSGGWIKTGHDKAIKTTGSRIRLNIVGAIDLNNISDATVNRYDKVNRESIKDFLETIRKKYPLRKKIHLILDSARYHCSQSLKDKAVEPLNIKWHY
jgi:hypothetical protein